jgi:hypothetical protein
MLMPPLPAPDVRPPALLPALACIAPAGAAALPPEAVADRPAWVEALAIAAPADVALVPAPLMAAGAELPPAPVCGFGAAPPVVGDELHAAV